MAEQGIYTLKINENFKQLIPPLSSAELQQLEQNIIRDGCREPLCVWNNTIIDGHNRYEICTRLQIPFSLQRIHFQNSLEATVWICANQLGRRNIADEARRYLIGKRYELEKIIGAHNAYGVNQHTKKEVRPKILTEPPLDKCAYRTRERLGQEYHISHYTVDRYGIYAQALDTLLKIVPDFVTKIFSGQIKITHDNVIELSQRSSQEICRQAQIIMNEATKFISYSSTRGILPKKHEKSLPTNTAFMIKEMPTYDPDAEISSLTLTIPSWVSSIERTRSNANFDGTSKFARHKLEKQLLSLKETIDIMLATIKEGI